MFTCAFNKSIKCFTCTSVLLSTLHGDLSLGGYDDGHGGSDGTASDGNGTNGDTGNRGRRGRRASMRVMSDDQQAGLKKVCKRRHVPLFW